MNSNPDTKFQPPQPGTPIEVRESGEALIPVLLEIGKLRLGRSLTADQVRSILPELTALFDKMSFYRKVGDPTGEAIINVLLADYAAIRNKPMFKQANGI